MTLSLEEKRERQREYNRRYNQTHKEAKYESNRQYQLEHKSEILKYARRYYHEHKEERAAHHAQYVQEHPEVCRSAAARSRAAKLGVEGSFTTEEFRLKCKEYENKCAYCGQEVPLGPDHMTPISKGGSNDIENVVPACVRCNMTKGTMTYDEFFEYIRTCCKFMERHHK